MVFCRKPWHRIWIALFFAALLLIGLATVRDYGMPFDEFIEMQVLDSTLREYAVHWSPESYFAGQGRPLMEIANRDRGICMYYPLALVIPSIQDNIRIYSYVWSVFTWLIFMMGCVSLYGILREIGASTLLSMAGTLMLYLCPRLFSEGHYNNKDVVLLCTMLFSLWMGIRLLKKPGYGRAVLLSLAGAISTNNRIAGAFPWIFMCLAAVVLVTVNKQWTRRMAYVALTAFASFFLFYFLLTPASWTDPATFFFYNMSNVTNYSRWDSIVLFRGAEFYDLHGTTPLPWYYVPFYMLVTIPLYTFVFAAIGLWYIVRSLFTERKVFFASPISLAVLAAILSWAVPVIYSCIKTPVLYNGWRHFYFCYAGLVVQAGYGIYRMGQSLKRSKALKAAGAGVLSLCLAFTAAGLALNHPYQFAYFNPLFPRDARRTMELDYWNVSDAGAFIELCRRKDSESDPLKVGCYFNDIKVGLYKLPESLYQRLEISTKPDDDYLYYNATYVHMYSVPEPPEGYHILFELKSYGNTIGVMYERD